MAFSSRRGRPRTPKPTIDFGTPELQLKHQNHLTHEPLDICLHKGILTNSQHWCGIHLRWLYTLRYGAPNASCRDISLRTHAPIRQDDPVWRAERESEYHDAVTLLTQYRAYERVMNLSVYHEIPAFLNAHLLRQAEHSSGIRQQLHREITSMQQGFRCLESHWKNEVPRQSTCI